MINSKKMRLTMFAASMVAAGALTGCFDDKSADPASPAVATEFSTTAAYGALVGADCVVNGTVTAALDTYTTDADGVGSISAVIGAGEYPLIISCTGGNYYNEASEATEANDETLKSIIPSAGALTDAGGSVAVTTLTSMAAALYESLPAAQRNSSTANQALTNVIKALAPGLGNGDGLDLLRAPTVVKSSASTVANNDAGYYASILAGLAKAGAGLTPALSPSKLAAKLAAETVTGTLDNNVVSVLKAKTSEFAGDKGDAALQQKSNSSPAPTTTVAKPTTGTGGTGGTGGSGAQL
ncbi:hypothetical protein [Zhongshania sp.]|uniref:hypothetical protein n=1 Tax=Zhongshania sp. TaxID=1971902 RepID=UPI003564B217